MSSFSDDFTHCVLRLLSFAEQFSLVPYTQVESRDLRRVLREGEGHRLTRRLWELEEQYLFLVPFSKAPGFDLALNQELEGFVDDDIVSAGDFSLLTGVVTVNMSLATNTAWSVCLSNQRWEDADVLFAKRVEGWMLNELTTVCSRFERFLFHVLRQLLVLCLKDTSVVDAVNKLQMLACSYDGLDEDVKHTFASMVFNRYPDLSRLHRWVDVVDDFAEFARAAMSALAAV